MANSRKRAYQQQYRRNRRRAGLCVSCSSPEPVKDGSTCGSCRAKMRDRYARRKDAGPGDIQRRKTYPGVDAMTGRREWRRRYLKRVMRVAFAAACRDCGNGDLRILEWDHVPGRGVKAGSVGAMASSASMPRLKAEIRKCDLVCANCHRIRSLERGQMVSRFWL